MRADALPHASALGATLTDTGAHFRVFSHNAAAMTLCLFVEGGETRVPMVRTGDTWEGEVPGVTTGALYGYRADGEWAPENGHWFDPTKLLVDPYATALDKPFVYDPRLSIGGEDTADLVPRAVLEAPLPDLPREAPRFTPGGLVYELHVRGFTMLHPTVPEAVRGTVAALAHPDVIAHLQRLHVSAVELMPIVAWIDERHLPPLGLSNYWGYNPIAPMALDPRLCPGGMAELRETVSALHEAGIGVILDLVFNHSGESDVFGPIIGMRGLDNATYYARDTEGRLINDTGTGNTLDFAQPVVRRMMLDTLRHFVRGAGIDGFRFDLAPVLARAPGFERDAPVFSEVAADPLLADRIMIAEPWDVGPGGYQLGNFPPNWLEWNDRYRDDVRRFWRGDEGVGALATRLAGSSDIFGPHTRSVNFLAAHDGFTLADTTAYETRHNWANGEENRDGHGENFSWNGGAEGPSNDPAVLARRDADRRALLATLFASAGAIMLTAGDEFGRSQQGNNNAYCQDNPLGWVDWEALDEGLLAFARDCAERRAASGDVLASFPEPGEWLRLDGAPMTVTDWENPATPGFIYRSLPPASPFTLRVDREKRTVRFGKTTT
ncbi:glycogen debranching protein GlgX [Sphingobium sp. CR28]|uniref:glycogen debranching protein GlgX n=1 Tax=Sphingobium sp. CR28 TaxID=3400272 RepID=UPI003FEECE73